MYSFLHPSSIVLEFVIATGIAGAARLATLPGNRAANRFAAALVLCLAVMGIDFLLIWTGTWRHAPQFIGLAWPTWFLLGPLYYLQIQSLTGTSPRPARFQLLHFFPYLLDLTLYIGPSAKKVGFVDAFFAAEPAPLSTRAILYPLVRFIHLGLYVYLGSALIRSFSETFKKRCSSADITWLENFRWVSYPLLGYLVFACVKLVVVSTLHPPQAWGFYVEQLAMGAFMIGSAAVSLAQARHALPPTELANGKYSRSRVTDEQMDAWVKKLEEVMNTGRPFLDPNLRLDDLAASLDISTHYLSQVLSQRLDTSFYEYVNRYRVAHAQQLFADPERAEHTYFAIARDAGFSSKTSFYRIFKKVAGVTPSQYVRSLQRST